MPTFVKTAAEGPYDVQQDVGRTDRLDFAAQQAICAACPDGFFRAMLGSDGVACAAQGGAAGCDGCGGSGTQRVSLRFGRCPMGYWS